MELRSEKILHKFLKPENQPFKLICMQEKQWLCSSYEPKERKEPSIALSEAWSNWVHKTKKFREWILLENIEPDISLDPKKRKYEVKIDFDHASKEWRENKVHLGEDGFRYKF